MQGQRQNLSMVWGFLHKIIPTEIATPEDAAGIFNHHKKLYFYCHVLRNLLVLYITIQTAKPAGCFNQPNHSYGAGFLTTLLPADAAGQLKQLLLQLLSGTGASE